MSEEIRFEVDGKDYFIKPVDSKVVHEAQKLYNKVFRKAIEDGCLLKKRLDAYMREQGLWNDQKEEEYKQLIKKIADGEFKLNSGNIKLSEAKKISLDTMEARQRLRDLIAEKTEMDARTAEGQAESQRFNFLVSVCSYDYETRKPVFSSYDDFLNRSNEKVTEACINKFANYLYGLDENYESTLAEVKFLKRFKFMDEEGNLLNKEGKKVDAEGNLLDDEGYRVDSEGRRIDINNNLIPTTTVEEVDFIDDINGE